MARVSKILIVGGGVGGMSLAICLERQQRAVELVDLDPDWRSPPRGHPPGGPAWGLLRSAGERYHRPASLTEKAY